MTMTLEAGHREQLATQEAGSAAPFRFAPTFIIDFVTSASYMIVFVVQWPRGIYTIRACEIAVLFGVVIACCYVGKVFIIGFLNKRGGDARTYVISADLVTTGLYSFSRNPTYLLTLLQYGLWSALLIFIQTYAPFDPVVLALSILLPVVFFVVMDRVIAREDAALSAAHPEAFAAYSKRVGRWFGRKRQA